jgi:DNA-binding CsgD family transcriptional regulator
MRAGLIAQGKAHLASGNWEQAQRSFEIELAEDYDTAEALDGLGQALWWLKNSQAAIQRREEAYVQLRRHGDAPRAARIALWLAREYDAALGNHAASSGWLARAETLLSGLAPSRDHGWLELARALEGQSPEVPVAEARAALTTFEELGAPREADATTALLRRLGAGARTGPKDYGMLSQREVEVLRVLGQGLTHGEIAARLYISAKTAGNHVSNILSKLSLRNRAEAAGYAQRYLPEISVPERS